MALTFDTVNQIIESSTSILDLPAFHVELRDWEDSEIGAINLVTHTWKAVSLGGGAYFYALDLINGWQLKFPAAGNYQIDGNLNGSIIPVAGVYVERKTSAAYTTTSIGSGGATPEQIAASVWQHTTGAAVAVKLSEAWGRLGLDPSNPLVTGQTQITFGDILLALSETGSDVTVTRT